MREPFETPDHPGLSVTGDGRGCNTLTGAFTIEQINFNYNVSPPAVLDFVASFTQNCEGFMPPLTGRIVFHAPPPADTTAPTTQLNVTGQPGKNGWYVSPVQVTLTPQDPDNSAAQLTTFYQLDNNSQLTYTTPFSITTNGAHTLKYWSVDAAGNAEAANTLLINLDLTVPTTKVSLSGKKGSNSWFRGPVQVSLVVTDTDNSPAQLTTEYQIDGGAAVVYSGSFTVSGDGHHTLSYWSFDNAGNIETTNSLSIAIDSLEPIVTMNTSLSSCRKCSGATFSVNGNISDTLSGIDLNSLSYKVTAADGLAQHSGSLVLNAQGNYSFHLYLYGPAKGEDEGRSYLVVVQAKDLAGNSRTLSQQIVVGANH